MKKILVILAVIGLIGGVWWLTGDKTNAPGNTTAESNNTYSTGSTGIELVEYGDFQCPSCEQFYPIIKEVKEKYKDTVTFRFRHFPLQTIHPNARAAHRAAEAAAKQSKFWEMHDALYETQSTWSSSSSASSYFETLATQIGLNMDQFKTDAAGSDVNAIINDDLSRGGRLNVTGTPTFFLDDKLLELVNINTVEKLSAIIDAAIAAKTPAQ